MANPLLTRIMSAWNAFRSHEEDTFDPSFGSSGQSYTFRPDRGRFRFTGERSIITSIYTRIGIDAAGFEIRHVKLDDQGRYSGDVDSKLNTCFKLQPNLDQGPRQFRQDLVMTLFDEGVAAIVPIDTTSDPTVGGFDIVSMRVGKIVDWQKYHVKVSVYNESKGQREDITVAKSNCAIVENPLYSVMNEPNSTLQRLVRTLTLLDTSDETSAGRLDLIIQLPYNIRNETRQKQAEDRREQIEMQLKTSEYGIAYSDSTEKITQLNRPVENMLLKKVEYLVNLLYDQLGITATVMNGTADEPAMLNYINRTIKPILDAAVEAMERSFLGEAGVNRSERIQYFSDPFALVPLSQIAVIADKLSRNEILTPNEVRGYLGIPPSIDPKADKLRNSNMPHPEDDQEDPQEDPV